MRNRVFFAAAARDPAFGTTNLSSPRFALRKCGPYELEQNLRPAGPTDRTEVVVLPAQRNWSPGASRALGDFVQSGGGLLQWLGDELSANRFNLDFANLAPVALRSVETAEDDRDWRMGENDADAAVFVSFRQPDRGNLALPRFLRRFALTPATGSRVRARFEDGFPLLIEQSVGRGRVLVAESDL